MEVIGAISVLVLFFLLSWIIISIQVLNRRYDNIQKDLIDLAELSRQEHSKVDKVLLEIAIALDAVSEVFLRKTNKVSKMKGSIDRFNKISDITKEQLDLFGAASTPSASASHSKYKNQINKQIKELEEKKHEIMRTLVKDGIDPVITMLDENGDSKSLKMSEALKVADVHPLTDQKTPRKKKGNVVSLFEEGDKDDEDDPGDPTIH